MKYFPPKSLAWLLVCQVVLFMNASAQNTYPAPQAPSKPSGAPAAPGDSFNPPVGGAAANGAPQIAEWTRTAGPDESIALTGVNLSRYTGQDEAKDTRFTVYSSNGSINDARVKRVDGDKAVITLQKNTQAWSMYLIWPGNESGYGTPIAVNKTDAWWVGPDRSTRGGIVSVFGRNLSKGNGTTTSHVYVRSNNGAGQWVTVKDVNPYRVQFEIPSNFANGDYEVWVHNGHGGDYGWSGPIKLTIDNGVTWKEENTFNVKNYGARGDGSTDDRNAINQAIAAAGSTGATVYFPAGTYMISGSLNLNHNIRWKGDVASNGKPASQIKLKNSFSGANGGVFQRYGNNGSVNTVHFENLEFISNGNTTGSGGDFMDLGSPQNMQWKNCIINSPGLNAFRTGWGYNVALLSTTFIGGNSQWGQVIFLDNGRQYILDKCEFRSTNDAGAAIINKAIKEVSVTNCIIRDHDNSRPDGWGKGRFWSHTGNDGSAYHGYFANNTGIDLTVRPDGPDQNSGEIFLWEANAVIWNGRASSATSTTVSLPGFGGSDKINYVVILKGRGMGQSRRIVSTSGGVVTLNEPWNVIPDNTSQIAVGPFVDKKVVYKNNLDGKRRAIENGVYTAAGGVVPYGGVFNFIAAENTIQELKVGISNWAVQHGSGVDATFFAMFVNNRLKDVRFGIYNGVEALKDDGVCLLGTMSRGNSIENPVQSAFHTDTKLGDAPVITTMVYEHNKIVNAPRIFSSGPLGNPDPRVDFGANSHENQIFYKNNITTTGTGIRITPKIALRENNYNGHPEPYWGTSGYSMIEAPYHVVDINATPGSSAVSSVFSLGNLGTSSLTWSASSDASWLKLGMTSGTVKSESDIVDIPLTANPSGLANGKHRATITVTDGSKVRKYTVVLNISGSVVAPKTPPTVSITAPKQNASFTTPAAVTINADAADTDGKVTKVEFWAGNNKLGEDATAPYSFDWTNVAAGSYDVIAKAFDNDGQNTTSAIVKVVVSAAPKAPVVSIVSPKANVQYTAPATVTIEASAKDEDGSVSLVEFFNGKEKIGEATKAPYSVKLEGLAAGDYAITAKATDNTKETTVSSVINFKVVVPAENAVPSVTLKATSTTTALVAPAKVAFTADAIDKDGSIVLVEFFNGKEKVGEAAKAPYTLQLDGLAAGEYTITAKATDNNKATAVSSAVSFKVAAPAGKVAPTVSLKATTATTNLVAPAKISFTADAADKDGSVTLVEFFNGGTKIGEATKAPYTIQLDGLAAGDYAITAKATDDSKLTAVTSAINFKVTAPVEKAAPSVTLKATTATASLVAPAKVAFTADASDKDGSVVLVEFFNGSQKVGEATNAPFTLQLDGLKAGDYTITAKAKDKDGLQTTSQAVSFKVAAEPVASKIAPKVSLMNPSDGQTFAAGSNIVVAADATDEEGTIAKVEFWANGQKLGEDDTAPYEITWNKVQASPYTIVAKAIDNSGLSANSASVNISVKTEAANQAPIVSVSTDAVNYEAPAKVKITATASDKDGSIAKVEFFAGNEKIGEDATAPYAIEWSKSETGSYAITAKATDNKGLSTTSGQVNIVVAGKKKAPSVKLTADGKEGAIAVQTGTVKLEVAASDEDGTITKVEFFKDGVKIGEKLTRPYTWSATNLAAGTHKFTATATDNDKLSTQSATVTVTVSKPAPVAPKVTLTASKTTALPTEKVTLYANATDEDGQVTKVEFFMNNQKIGEDRTAPYEFTRDAASIGVGTYPVYAKATDNSGLVTVSNTINITITKQNVAPEVKLDNPIAGSNFLIPATIPVSATATDKDGSIAKVEFFANNTKIGESKTAPYRIDWKPTTEGTYTITAKATDNGGLTKTSSSATVNLYNSAGGKGHNGYIKASPNPFVNNTTVELISPIRAYVAVKLLNQRGDVVAKLHEGILEQGQIYKVKVNGTHLPNGTYTVAFMVNDGRQYFNQMFFYQLVLAR